MEEVSKWVLIMNYGLFYKEVSFNRDAMNIVRKAISSPDLNWKKDRYTIVVEIQEVLK